MRILLTGSHGYKGSVLLPKLWMAGHDVITLDTGWFGGAPDIKADIREIKTLPKVDCIIHLANIANDPCGELDSKLTWEVNGLATVFLCEAAVNAGIHRFIFASSASVYGIKGNAPVVETTSLEPVSDYNKTKMTAERVLLSYADKMNVQIVRPATVCGYSPRMRLDVIVNMLTMQALTKGEITAHCGEHGQGLMRPHTHMQDVTDLYLFMLDHPEHTGIYNAGFENLSVAELAERIVAKVPANITVTKVQDKRSYRVDSSKLLKAGFQPKYTVDDAIDEIAEKYRAGELKDELKHYNLAWMRSQNLLTL
jgi:nucleoside-diphosphate-sugar epimerase